jgi:hypothetical protein
MLKKVVLPILASASLMAMHQAEININDKDLETQLRLDMGQFNDATDPDTVFVGIRYINADKENSDYNEDPDLLEFNFLMQKPMRDNDALTLGLGAKLVTTDYGNADFMASPLGLEGSAKLPLEGAVPVYLSGSAYFAPEVLSYKDAKQYFEYKFSLDAEIIDNGKVMAGYRNIETKYENSSSLKMNKGWFVGFKIAF